MNNLKGIYLIENRLNGHKYIGRSVDIPTRWNQHIYSSKRGDGFAINRALRKYGVENFNFTVLEETDDIVEREKYWYYKLNPEYNIIAPDELPNKVQSICVKSLNKDTGEVLTYESIREAARQNGISKTAILNVLNKKRNSAANYFWAYEDEEFIIPIDRGNNGTRRKSVTIKKDDLELSFDSMSEAERYLGVTHGVISGILKGKTRQKRVKGFTVELNL